MIGQILQAVPRLARIAKAGAGMTGGIKAEAVLGQAIQSQRAVDRAAMARQLTGGRPLRSAGVNIVRPTPPMQVDPLIQRAETVAGKVNSSLPTYDSWSGAYNSTNFADKAVFNTARVGGGIGRVAGEVLVNPAGQMGLFVGAPMLMAGSGQTAPPESYQDMGAIAPAMTPPDSYQQMYSSSYGVPATPQLDEEQIRRARKRAEEQAALNQFYAQALNQYQGQ